MLEKQIEKKLVAEIKGRGGLAIKLNSLSMSGLPDRLVLLPGGKIAFVELKSPGKTMRLQQVLRKRQLERLGFLVCCIDSVEKVRGVVDEIQST